jgi:hypothetical protein
MQNISTAAGLKNAIQLLEDDQAIKRQLLKEQFFLTYEGFRPINLLKKTLNDIASSPFLIDNILGAATGLAAGYYTKKIVVSGSGNMFRKLIGSILQYGVTKIVATHPDAIKSFGTFIIQNIFHKKAMNSKKP